MKSYKDMIVWQKSFRLVLLVYRVTKHYPKEEVYVLVSQMRRAAISIPSNVAEGYARRSGKEYWQYTRTAYASAIELETQLLISKELGYIDDGRFEEIYKLLVEVLKMLTGLSKSLSEDK